MSDVELPTGGAIEPPAVAAEPPAREHAFEFHGDTREYFRIWIVNLGLSIATLGVYSAWAKVRTQRYFYANTLMAGTPFEYLAQPLPILKGRLLAVLVFGGYVLSGHFLPKVQLAFALLIALFSPWLIVKGLRFRARYSAWRTLNFRFVGTFGDAYMRFLVMYLLVPITLGIAYPYVKSQQKHFVVGEHRYGGRAFKFLATNGDFYPPYLAAFFMVLVWYFAVFFVGFTLISSLMRGTSDPDRIVRWPFYVLFATTYAGLFFAAAYLAARLNNLVYNNAELAGHRMHSTLRARDLIGLYLSNTLAILASVGLLIPWAMIRMARYRASRLTLLAAGDLDDFVASASPDVGASGAEMDALFDIDIGF